MNIKRILLSGLILTSLSYLVFAQSVSENNSEVLNLTIEDAVSMAIENNISIKQSRMALSTLEKKNKYSWNSVSPSLSLSGGVSDSLPNGKIDNTLSYSVSGSVNMRFTPALITSINSARIAYENGELSYESTIRSVEKSVRSSFYSLLSTCESMDSYRVRLDAAQRTYETNLAKYSRGQVDQLTLLNSQYNYESLIPTIAKAQNAYDSSLNSFKQVLGIKLNQEVRLSGSMDDVLNVQLDDSILSFDVENLASIKKAKLSVETAENALKATKYSAYGPTVSLGYSYSGGAGISPSSDYGTRSNGLSLQVNVPLDSYLPWSNTAINIGDLQNNIETAKMNLESAKTNLQMTIRNNYNSIIEAQVQMKLQQSNLELMQKAYDLTLIAYNNGSKDLNALQTAEDNLATARFNLQSQKFQIINSVINLEDTLGLPFGTLSQRTAD